MRRDYIALIPAYKPSAPVLTPILKQLKEAQFDVVVVDDGGGEEFAGAFAEFKEYATVLTHEVNRGKGAALKTGLTYIQEQFGENSVIVTIDADGQHTVDDSIKVCELAEQEPGALIIGSRDLGKDIPLRSWFGNTVTRLVFFCSTGVKVYDTQSGLRAFSAKLLPNMLAVSGDRYEYEMNVLLEFARGRIPIRETTIKTIYEENNASSHFDTIRDSYRIYKEILKFSASSFISFLIDYVMYTLLLLLTSNLRLSNIGARIVSSIANYTINRRLVFKDKGSIAKSALEYFLLAAVILLGNTIVLEILANHFGIHQLLAKIITELIFFTLSWLVQRFIIFRKGKKGKK